MDVVDVLNEAPKTALSSRHARALISHLEAARGQLADVVRLNPWLVGVCQSAATEKLGASFPVFRAITATSELRPDEIASTSLDWRVAMRILDDAPGMVWHGGKTLTTTSVLRRYVIDPSKVVLWMPVAVEFAKDAVRGAEHRGVPNRHGTTTSIAKILASFDELDEQEIVADLTGLTPQEISFGGDVRGRELAAVFSATMAGDLEDPSEWRQANHITFLSPGEIAEAEECFRSWRS
jgi:hypothetical protein